MPTGPRLKTLLHLLVFPALGSILVSCGILNRAGSSPEHAILLDTLDRFFVYADTVTESMGDFHPTFEQTIDVHHVELDLSFDWPKEEVIGKEKLSISAYFYPQDTIVLDARGFEIKELLVDGDSTAFEYDGLQIAIPLKESISKTDTVIVSLDYVARPSKLTSTAGTAITSDQGLYFIDPLGLDPNKPTQLWTQGEPESNSGWFALVDKPVDKFTQEVFLTVDSSYATLSNGKLIYSTVNTDGTRTDYWKQSLPHSGYLAMLTVGDFAIEKDEWNGLDVWYYVPHEYAPYAKSIFGNTPEMLQFYSDLLKTPYPWEKYHQVVVEDFVSGAMENTSAVVHSSFVARTDQELLDVNYEDVIAHELFHHWFGDLVTSESWAQITMNEGFATYGEYLWKEYKYGRKAADFDLHRNLISYLREQQQKSVPLIRNHYHTPDDVFDSHSYEKGGRVLHMLRQEVGDDAFFESLRLYLEENAYQPVEESMLRLAFERTTGRDLRWFFNQWFHRDAHPGIAVSYGRDTNNNDLIVRVSQNQNLDPFQFHLPLHYSTDGEDLHTKQLWVEKYEEEYRIPVPMGAAWYGVNVDGALLGTCSEEKSESVWRNQALTSPFYYGRFRAAVELDKRYPNLMAECSMNLMQDDFWTHRLTGVELAKPYLLRQDSALKAQLVKLCQDPKSQVRYAALAKIDTVLGDSSTALFRTALLDSSLMVQQMALKALAKRDPCSVLSFCDSLEQTDNEDLDQFVSLVYAKCGDESKEEFFYKALERSSGLSTMLLNQDLVNYTIRVNEPAMVDRVIEHLFASVQKDGTWWMTYSALDGLEKLRDFIHSKIEVLEQHPDLTNSEAERLARWKNKRASISALLEEVQESEHTGSPEVYLRGEN